MVQNRFTNRSTNCVFLIFWKQIKNLPDQLRSELMFSGDIVIVRGPSIETEWRRSRKSINTNLVSGTKKKKEIHLKTIGLNSKKKNYKVKRGTTIAYIKEYEYMTVSKCEHSGTSNTTTSRWEIETWPLAHVRHMETSR